jgi:nucleotide-binding universal stress UspA family protein
MKKILVPTDFSENAFNALIYAAELFKYEPCSFFIVHTYADVVYRQEALHPEIDVEALKNKEEEKAAQLLHQLEKRFKETVVNPNHQYTFISVFADLVDAINDWADQEDIDLVIMGTRGETNKRSKTFGSNTLHVLKYVHCPVLAVPEGYQYNRPKEVLFPSNYLVPYNRRELGLLDHIVGASQAKIHLLYIDPIKNFSMRQKDNKRILEHTLERPKLEFVTTEEKDKTLAISKYIVHKNIDLLTIVNSRHSYIEDMLYQSTIDQLGLHVKIPFLVLQNVAR